MNPKNAADFLQTVEGEWEGLCRGRTPQQPFPRTYVAYETLATHGVKIVPALYTSHISDGASIAFDYDHMTIVKPANRDSDVYRWAKARIMEASSYQAERPSSPLLSGHNVLYDAFSNQDASGLEFATGAVVAWYSGRADLLVSNTSPPQAAALFFTQEDAGGVYQNAPPDKGANGGIVRMEAQRLDGVDEAPITGYLSHWFRAEPGGIYCVRTRDGKHYAKIQVTDLQTDRIVFDWVYQPGASRQFR